jgi:hypothetical protein
MHKNHKGKIKKEWLGIMEKTLIYLNFLEWCPLKTKKYKYFLNRNKTFILKIVRFWKINNTDIFRHTAKILINLSKHSIINKMHNKKQNKEFKIFLKAELKNGTQLRKE